MKTLLSSIVIAAFGLTAFPIANAEKPEIVALSKGEIAKIKGKIQFVDSFPDYKVQVVDSFPDLKVKVVTSFPDDAGEWQIVDSFPDYKIQIVSSFGDFKIKYVDSFPGLP
ncbi:MAG: hypothetical protein ACI8UO_000249 [Verrucomicrobiales bacterium]|jgi:hypothetical protein